MVHSNVLDFKWEVLGIKNVNKEVQNVGRRLPDRVNKEDYVW